MARTAKYEETDPKVDRSRPVPRVNALKRSDYLAAIRGGNGTVGAVARALNVSAHRVDLALLRWPDLRDALERAFVDYDRTRYEVAEGAKTTLLKCVQRKALLAEIVMAENPRAKVDVKLSEAEKKAWLDALKNSEDGRRRYPRSPDVVVDQRSVDVVHVSIDPETLRNLPRDVRQRLLQGDPAEIERLASLAAEGSAQGAAPVDAGGTPPS